MRQSIRRVQYASSLYVDTFEKVAGAHFVKPTAPVLVLAGTIGKSSSFQTQAFLGHCSRLWRDVIYIPAVYDDVHKTSNVISNVHVLDNRVLEIGDVVFVGSQYRTTKDVCFVDSVLEDSRYSDKRLVAVTSGSVIDGRWPLPPYNLWICGHKPGGRVLETRNGVLVAYNSRGSICGPNDFDGRHGWRRDAVIEIPDDHWSESTLDPVTGHGLLLC